MNTQVAAFAGVVSCVVRVDGAMLRLQGRSRDGTPLTLWFSACKSAPLPASLRDVTVHAEPNDGAMQWRIIATGVDQVVQARSVQVQREPASVWLQAVAPPQATLAGRVGWALLLNLLRLPGAGRLLKKLRAN